ncbi:uncharacterized protein [Halyomorpha halys]|uniref:uncharacterized protein n=1 Tax=Halyomorpha halys TaxID=286706 RepID=UPI0034D21413
MLAELESSVAKYCFLMRYCGAFPVTIFGSVFTLNRLHMALSLFQILVLLGLLYHRTSLVNFYLPLIYFLVILHGICTHILLPLNFIWSVLKIKQLNRVMQVFVSIDISLLRMGIKCKNSVSLGFTLAQSLAVTCVIGAMVVSRFPVHFFFFHTVPTLPMITTTLFFSFFINLVGERFAVLTAEIRPVRIKLIFLTSLYNELWQLFRDLNSLFSLQVFIIIASSMSTIVIYFFYLIKRLQAGTNSQLALPLIVWFLGWVMLYISFALNVIHICHKVSVKVDLYRIY